MKCLYFAKTKAYFFLSFILIMMIIGCGMREKDQNVTEAEGAEKTNVEDSAIECTIIVRKNESSRNRFEDTEHA